MKSYDLLVIGSGPAGQAAALQAARLGKSVLVVEKRNVVGGVSTHTGTIPTKTLREALAYLSGMRQRGILSDYLPLQRHLTMSELERHIDRVIRHEIEMTRDQFARNGIELLQGRAAFESDQQVRVVSESSEEIIQAERIVIATGTRPLRPADVPFNDRTVMDTDRVFQARLGLERLPRSLLIVGAGVIGTEYACLFRALGVDVRLLDRRKELLRFVDQEIAEVLAEHLREQGISLYLDNGYRKIDLDEDGRALTTLTSGRQIKTDAVVYATGRVGATAELGLDRAGVETGERGMIRVNEVCQTNVAHIYAAGDITGFPGLASISLEHGRLAACHAFGAACDSSEATYPYGIYTIPEISMVGKTERQLAEEGVPYEVGRARFSEVPRGSIIGDRTGLLKLLFHREDRRILGVHLIGEGASELLHIGQAVMALEGTVEYFTRTVFNVPTLAEVYKLAAARGMGEG